MLGVLINPHAHQPKRDPSLIGAVRDRVGASGEVIVSDTLASLVEKLEALRARGMEELAILGGDGTLSHTVTALDRLYGDARWPTLSFLGGGTINTIAKNFGLRGAPLARLDGLLLRQRSSRAPVRGKRRLLRVGDRSGFVFAAAMGARFIHAYDAAPTGLVPAARLTLRTALSCLVNGPLARDLFRPIATRYQVDDHPAAHEDFRLLLASVVSDVGLGFRVTWQADLDSERFHFVASGVSPPLLALQLPRVWTGRRLTGKPHVDQLASTVSLEFATAEPVTLDGEILEMKSISISCGRSVDFVVDAPL